MNTGERSRWQQDLVASANELIGHTIAKVYYIGLCTDKGAFDRDYGEWHDPIMDVEFVTTERTRFWATWQQNPLDDFHLTLSRRPVPDKVVGDRQVEPAPAWDEIPTPHWDMTTHPRWATLIGQSVEAVTPIWSPWPDSGPWAIRLDFTAGTVWLVAVWELDDGYWLGGDDIAVVFDEKVMARMRISSP
ncbi:hypothetical protein ACFQZZ_15375 [Nocardia sp. GCM10030253]|uniref:hypothetical protein n=1 Tax=Nocardia sp. GCM10030253 TaxID=3273404 RepID=UPI003645F52B